MASTRKQVVKKAPNPTGKGGFQERPQDRHHGAWKKENTARYKLEQMMQFGSHDLAAVIEDEDSPVFEKKLAEAIINGQWREIKEMMTEVYGTPKQNVDVVSDGAPLALVKIVGGRDS